MHYFRDYIAAPITNEMTVQVMFVLMHMYPHWVGEVIDVEGAFLQGKFKNGVELFMEIPDGMEGF